MGIPLSKNGNALFHSVPVGGIGMSYGPERTVTPLFCTDLYDAVGKARAAIETRNQSQHFAGRMAKMHIPMKQ